jgi:hypothetical protein
VIGVHHSGKDEERGMRGSSALEGAGDCVIHLKREEGSQNVTLHVEKQKDGEAIQPMNFVLESIEWQDGLKVASTLVPVATQEASMPSAPSPDRETIREILKAIDLAWKDNRPWSNAVQTKREGRFAARLIWKQFGIRPDAAERIIMDLLDNEILAVEVCDPKTKTRGLTVKNWSI